MKSIIYFSILLFLLSNCTNAITVRNKTISVKHYELAEWELETRANFTNPYRQQEIQVNMHLISPTGKLVTLPCFYESGESGKTSVWKARFTPQELGKYSYYFQLIEHNSVIYTTSSAEFVSELSGKRGFLHTHDNWTLKYDNGEIFRGIRMNFCWESRDEDDSKYFQELHEDKRFNYENMLSKLQQNGGNFFRT